MALMNEFVYRYPITKTLRFKLVPVEGTAERINAFNIIDSDEALSENYKKMKCTGDEFHKDFIQKVLSTVHTLKNYDWYCSLLMASPEEKREPSYRKDLSAATTALKTEISNLFSADPDYKKIFKKEFLTELLPAWIARSGRKDELYFDESFKRRSTLFANYHTARKVLYGEDGLIVRRIVDENIPRHLANCEAFRKVQESEIADCINEIKENLCVCPEDWFSKDSLILTQDVISMYNAMIGGFKPKSGNMVKGFNSYISEYNQVHRDKLPLMTQLYKMVLSDRESVSWLPEAFNEDMEVIEAVFKFHREAILAEEAGKNFCSRAVMFVGNLENYAPDKVFVRDEYLATISLRLFGGPLLIRSALEYYYTSRLNPNWTNIYERSSEKKQEKLLKERRKFIVAKFMDLSTIDRALSAYAADNDSDESVKIANVYYGVTSLYGICTRQISEVVMGIMESYADLENLYRPGMAFNALKAPIKKYLDAVVELRRLLRMFYCDDTSYAQDEILAAEVKNLFDVVANFPKLYDKVRSFATKKPFSTEKFSLSFGKIGNFLGGWVDSYSAKSDGGTASSGYLFRKQNAIGEYDYFLGISLNTHLFRAGKEIEAADKSDYERLEYYQVSSKTVYGSSYEGSYADDKAYMLSVLRSYIDTRITEQAVRDELISYLNSRLATPLGCMNRIENNYPEVYAELLEDPTFNEANSYLINKLLSVMQSLSRLEGTDIFCIKTYHSFTEVMADIENVTRCCRTYRYHPVSRKEMECAFASEDKPLYLFRISNKDLDYATAYAAHKRSSRGRDNTHTMIFKALMSGTQQTYDLGTGEVFFRPASIPERDTHPANVPIRSKCDPEKTNVFPYAIKKDRRYMYDQYEFHLSVLCNYSATDTSADINRSVLRYLAEHKDVNIIGINRGEYNLLYITIIDQEGHILRDKNGRLLSYALNDIVSEYTSNGETHQIHTDYREKLSVREALRDEQRREWEQICNIKDLKSGYLSQVVHHIVQLMIEYNAVICLEDLNARFKQKRTAVELSVYQQFEHALIDKLNLCIVKTFSANVPGGINHPLQLTAPFKSFAEIRTQTGCIFYVNPWMVTRTDPATGFTDQLYVPTNAPRQDFAKFYQKMESIRYNPEKQWFEFKVDYRKYDALLPKSVRTEWTICTHGKERWLYDNKMNNNKGGYKKVDVTLEIEKLLSSEGIKYKDGHNILGELLQLNNRSVYAALYALLKLVTRMHYRVPASNIDRLISPVVDKNNAFFDSSKTAATGLPIDGDSNASYNIARKCLWGIRMLNDDDLWFRGPSKYEWIKFLQQS